MGDRRLRQQLRGYPDAQRLGNAVTDLEHVDAPWAMSLGGSSRLSTRPFTTTTASSASLWPCSVHRLGEDHDLDRRPQVLEGEHGHQVALPGPLALQAGDDAAERLRSRPSSNSSRARRACRRSAGAGRPRRPAAGGRSRRGRASPSRTPAAPACRTRGRGWRCARSSPGPPSSPPPNSVMTPMSRSRRRATVWSMICSNTVSRPLRGWPSVSKAPALISDSIVRLLSTWVSTRSQKS